MAMMKKTNKNMLAISAILDTNENGSINENNIAVHRR